jgi:hypothetical protein
MINARMKRQEENELAVKNNDKNSKKVSFFKKRVRRVK